MRRMPMKSLVSLVLGVSLAVAVFIGAVAAVAWLISEQNPHRFANLDERPLWTNRPVKIDPASQDYERMAAAPVPPVFQAMAVDIPEDQEREMRMASQAQSQEPGIDETTTGAVDAGMELAGTPHDEWCSQKYRSYRVGDNSYQPYSGPRRQCMSPYMGSMQVMTGPDEPQPEPGFHDVAESGYRSEDPVYARSDAPRGQGSMEANPHLEWCFARYNSYRPQDNTYQPYNGPRRQCTSPFG